MCKSFTLSAHLNGGPTSMGKTGVDRVYAALDFHHNIPSEIGNAEADAWIGGFHKQFPDFDYTWINYRTMFEMLQSAINKAGSTDPMKIALALEGMEVTDALGQKNTMRRDDHQLIDQLYTAVFTTGVKYEFGKNRFRLENGADHAGIAAGATDDMQDETTCRSVMHASALSNDRCTSWLQCCLSKTAKLTASTGNINSNAVLLRQHCSQDVQRSLLKALACITLRQVVSSCMSSVAPAAMPAWSAPFSSRNRYFPNHTSRRS